MKIERSDIQCLEMGPRGKRGVFYLLLSLTLLGGCAGRSKLIEENQFGGRVMVFNSQSDSARKGISDAHKKMRKKCPDGYLIEREGWMRVSMTYEFGDQDLERFFQFKCKNIRQSYESKIDIND